MIQPVDVVIRVVCVLYFLFLYSMLQLLQKKSIDLKVMSLTYIMIATCPCLWGLIRCIREWAARKKPIPIKIKQKKKPDIATKKDIKVAQTQAEILQAQRKKAKEIGGVVDAKSGDKKKKAKTPKRKGPPKPKKDKTENV
ncbi:hypothetical protein THRCLA_21207 [Thraustotheca clavata]|uniref:Transmembrane protein n=1 Tax=Thraustotheca clavata TaxID=74557 RepID=A0A1V9ZZM8_9STRA|nr:hypothetical protein THRCLA_21207 [Thraustotheca clavata]